LADEEKEELEGGKDKMARYNLQARQFGRVLIAAIIEAPSRAAAINKFKKKYYADRGYVINAQQIIGRRKRKKRRRRR